MKTNMTFSIDIEVAQKIQEKENSSAYIQGLVEKDLNND